MTPKSGPHLREFRQSIGLSQSRLAELAGVDQFRISAYELGKAELPAAMAQRIARALSDADAVTHVAKRRKRYTKHTYQPVEHAGDRVARAQRTPGNPSFLRALNDLAEHHASRRAREFSALSLFSGCGGFSLGFSAAGFDVTGFLDVDPGARKIYSENFPKAQELGGDIRSLSDADLSALAARMGGLDALIGGPPCQGFSLSGKRSVRDERNTLFMEYLRIVDALRPKVAIIENVRLLTSMKSPTGGLVKDEIVSGFEAHGYQVQMFEVNMKHYGVPQHRERVLFVAVRKDLQVLPSIPAPTHLDQKDLFGGKVILTFGDACSDLQFLESGEKSEDSLHFAVAHPKHVIEWLWDVPEGQSAHDNEDPSKRPPSGYNTTYKRQVWNEPAATVQTTFGMISGCRNVHPISTRSLTIREAARLQTFPDSFRFVGTLGAIRTAIGNAVPPLFAYCLAEHIRDEILKLIEVSSF